MARKRTPAPPPAPELVNNLAGLIQACKDDPDADDLRLILADYLEDHGEPARADLIRLGLAVAGKEAAGIAALHARIASRRNGVRSCIPNQRPASGSRRRELPQARAIGGRPKREE